MSWSYSEAVTQTAFKALLIHSLTESVLALFWSCHSYSHINTIDKQPYWVCLEAVLKLSLIQQYQRHWYTALLSLFWSCSEARHAHSRIDIIDTQPFWVCLEAVLKFLLLKFSFIKSYSHHWYTAFLSLSWSCFEGLTLKVLIHKVIQALFIHSLTESVLYLFWCSHSHSHKVKLPRLATYACQPCSSHSYRHGSHIGWCTASSGMCLCKGFRQFHLTGDKEEPKDNQRTKQSRLCRLHLYGSSQSKPRSSIKGNHSCLTTLFTVGHKARAVPKGGNNPT